MMPTPFLSDTQFQKARQFVKAYARPVDLALFELYFEGGSPDRVMEELAAFQNDDGGFGHGIEPDIRLKASSPMATSVGLQYAVEAGAGEETPLVRRAIRYLLDTLDRQNGSWPSTFLDVNNEPHAPWWHRTALIPPSAGEWPNPSAELLGCLYRWPDGVERGLLETLSRRAWWSLEAGPGSHPANNMLCWQRAYPSLPGDLQAAVTRYLQAALGMLDFRPEALMEMRVAWLAPSPSSPVAQVAGPVIRELIEAELEKQSPDGSWQPNWQWGQYPEAWEVAKREWAGKITVEILHALQEWGFLEKGSGGGDRGVEQRG